MTPRRKTRRPNFSAVARAARSWKASWALPRDFKMSIVGKNGSSITGSVKTGLKGSANQFVPHSTKAQDKFMDRRKSRSCQGNQAELFSRQAPPPCVGKLEFLNATLNAGKNLSWPIRRLDTSVCRWICHRDAPP